MSRKPKVSQVKEADAPFNSTHGNAALLNEYYRQGKIPAPVESQHQAPKQADSQHATKRPKQSRKT